MRKLLGLFCLGGLLISCGGDSGSSPEVLESSSSQIEPLEESSSSLMLSSSSEMSSSAESSSSSPYVEKHLAWNYLNPALSYGEVTDERDGHVYKYIEVDGYLRFMAENLNYTDSIANPNLLGSSWCPNNDLDSCSKYGRLYTWAAAMNVDEFFIPEGHWLSFSPWKEMIEERNRWLAGIKRSREEADRGQPQGSAEEIHQQDLSCGDRPAGQSAALYFLPQRGSEGRDLGSHRHQ